MVTSANPPIASTTEQSNTPASTDKAPAPKITPAKTRQEVWVEAREIAVTAKEIQAATTQVHTVPRAVFLVYDGFEISLLQTPNVELDAKFRANRTTYESFNTWLKENKDNLITLTSRPAISGIKNYNYRKYQSVSGKGPIPYGVWKIDFGHWRAKKGDENRGYFAYFDEDAAYKELVRSTSSKNPDDYGTGGWALVNVHAPLGLHGRSGFAFHEDAKANGTAGCIGVAFGDILNFFLPIFRVAQRGSDDIYLLVQNYEEGLLLPSWGRRSQ